MIEVYSIDRNRDFFLTEDVERHADIVLNPISATLTMELYGGYTLDVTCPLSDYMHNNDVVFTIGSVVVVDMIEGVYPTNMTPPNPTQFKTGRFLCPFFLLKLISFYFFFGSGTKSMSS